MLVLLSFGVGLAASWRRWGNPLVDCGRELNVPLRLSRGEILYSDVGYLYGPLSPYVNAALYALFRPSLWLVWARGIATTVILLALIYWLARQLMSRRDASLACMSVVWVCALKPQGNLILPYSFSGLDGSVCALATTICLIQFLRVPSRRALAGAAGFASLAMMAKTELGLAALGAGVVAGFLAGYPDFRKALASIVFFLFCATALSTAGFALIAAHVGWKTIFVNNHVFFCCIPWQLLYFNGYRFGFARPFHSILLMIVSMARMIAFGGFLAAVALIFERRSSRAVPGSDGRTLPRMLGILLVSLLTILLTSAGLSDLGPFLAMPLCLLCMVVVGFVAFTSAVRTDDAVRRVQSAIFLTMVCIALASLARIVLRVSTGGALSSFLLPSTVMAFIYMWTVLFPAFLWNRPSAQLMAQRMVFGVLAIGVCATAITISLRYQRRFTYPLVTPRGTWLVPPDVGIPFAQALQLISSATRPNDSIAAIPEGTSLHFFSGRRNPLHDEIVTPGFLDTAGEAKAISALRDFRTKLVFVASRPTPEFFQEWFGIDYDTKLMSWINSNYDKCESFGANPRFRIEVYCLTQPDIGLNHISPEPGYFDNPHGQISPLGAPAKRAFCVSSRISSPKGSLGSPVGEPSSWSSPPTARKLGRSHPFHWVQNVELSKGLHLGIDLGGPISSHR